MLQDNGCSVTVTVLQRFAVVAVQCLMIVLLPFSFSAFQASAQHKSITFKQLTVAQGLSQNTVTSILQDSRGFMWFGTWDGLNKYDGYNFTIYQNDPSDSTSIAGNRITELLEDRDGNLWITSSDGGLSKYIRNTGKFVQFRSNARKPNSLNNNNASCIIQDREGIIWIGTNGGGLNRFDPETGEFRHFMHRPEKANSISDNEITQLIEDAKGNLWIGTDNHGVDVYDKAKDTFQHFVPQPSDSNSISHHYVRTLYEDGKGNIWIGTNGGLNQYLGEGKGFKRYVANAADRYSISKNVILALQDDAEGNLWVGTENGGISILCHAQNRFYNHKPEENIAGSLNSGSIYSVYLDKHQNMWIGTFNGGVNWVDRFEKGFRSYKHFSSDPNSLSANYVNWFAQDQKGLVWIATDGGGLNQFNPETGAFLNYTHNPNDANSLIGNFMTMVVADKGDRLWMGSWEAGITELDPTRKKFTRYTHDPANPNSLSSANPNCVTIDSAGNLWVGTYGGGINKFNAKTKQYERFLHKTGEPNSISSNYLRAILAASDGKIWMGTLGAGVSVFDPQQDTFQHYVHQEGNPQSLASNSVYTLFEDKAGEIWIGTSGGLMRYNKATDGFVSYTKSDGLANNAIMTIQQDRQGNLWLGTKLGLCKFNPKTRLVRNYSQEDGLQGNEFNQASLESRNGKLYFGGTNGFTVFHPDSIKDNPLIPPVYLTNFLIFNKAVQVNAPASPLQKVITETSELVLSHEHSVFTLEYAALNYTIPEKNQYAYMMKGFDLDWNYVGTKRSATYTNLNPGEYFFYVKAANNDGVWNENPLVLKITIVPPWWHSWWFRAVFATLMTGIVFVYYKRKLITVEEENKKLDKLVDERTTALQKANEEIREINKQLFSRQEEIKAQNEELSLTNNEMQQREEEIAFQRDLLAKQNLRLSEAKKIIEAQKQELLLHNQKLDEEVQERTRELVEYNQQLEQFAFIAGHNLRAPVARILGLGQVLKLSNISKEEEKQIKEKIILTTEELDRVVRDINTILEIGKDNTMVRSELSLSELLKVLKANIENDICHTNAQIIADFSAIDNLYSVRPYIESILFNLLHNAIKYRHPDRNPIIKLSTCLLPEGMCLEVSDNGLGIDLSLHQKKIFSLYKRFHSHVEGKGMGLYLVKTQVGALGGKIEVDTTLGVGTAFRIYLQNSCISNQSTTAAEHLETTFEEDEKTSLK